MLEIILLLAPLFAMIGAGYFAGLSRIADTQWVRILNLFGYYIAFPALILKSIIQADINLSLHGIIIVAQLVLGIGLFGLTYWICTLFKMSPENRNTFLLGIYFVNSGYIGVPALEIVFGPEAAAAGAITTSVMILIVFTLGITILEKSRQKTVQPSKIFLNIIKNPLMWAAGIGLLIGFSNIELLETVERFINLMAGAASPTVLVALGVFLAINHPKKSTLKLSGILVGIKMLLLPTIMTISILAFGDKEWLQITYIQASMPIAITAFAFAEIYPMNKPVISTSILLSTLLGIIIIPLTMWLTTVL